MVPVSTRWWGQWFFLFILIWFFLLILSVISYKQSHSLFFWRLVYYIGSHIHNHFIHSSFLSRQLLPKNLCWFFCRCSLVLFVFWFNFLEFQEVIRWGTFVIVLSLTTCFVLCLSLSFIITIMEMMMIRRYLMKIPFKIIRSLIHSHVIIFIFKRQLHHTLNQPIIK